ncbi:hypothetical protein DSCO28_07880 [Desulfosarcina ovata subsp. sediminis]|uniref:Uncharacterized protein n=1 Tax=Desulfosarcina ovata subsp. sediminis TaxID=885957 RepID=A0A5K7ZDY4_9BACT|nr:hypothetical protein [Desulfosarcina ovata]BBO80222.1 hypothetical protein DSCO28_07880 [Desulfosarcina ovata subsp. sediminis]
MTYDTALIAKSLEEAEAEIRALRVHNAVLLRHNRLFAQEYEKLKERFTEYKKMAAHLPPSFSLPEI